MSGRKARESWRCPALVTRASGRHPESAAKWILVVSPPRDRPSASRSHGLPAVASSLRPGRFTVRLRGAAALGGVLRWREAE